MHKKNLLKEIIISFVLLIICLFMSTMNVSAEGLDYTVSPILGQNQDDKIKSYFKLKLQPNQQENLQFNLENFSEKPQKFNIKVNTASTNMNGIVDYSRHIFQRDPSMKFSLQELIDNPQSQIEIPGHSKKIVSLKLNMPDTIFDGVLLGGVTIEPALGNKNKEQVSNIYTRTIAIVVSENDKKIVPEIVSGDVRNSQINYHNISKIALRNISPTIIKPVKAHIRVYKSGSEKSLLDQTKYDMSIAPNSQFELPVEWKRKLKTGHYQYKVRLDTKEKSWFFVKEFEIKSVEAKVLNKQSVDKDSTSILYIIVAIVFLVMAALICRKCFKNKEKVKSNAS